MNSEKMFMENQTMKIRIAILAAAALSFAGVATGNDPIGDRIEIVDKSDPQLLDKDWVCGVRWNAKKYILHYKNAYGEWEDYIDADAEDARIAIVCPEDDPMFRLKPKLDFKIENDKDGKRSLIIYWVRGRTLFKNKEIGWVFDKPALALESIEFTEELGADWKSLADAEGFDLIEIETDSIEFKVGLASSKKFFRVKPGEQNAEEND